MEQSKNCLSIHTDECDQILHIFVIFCYFFSLRAPSCWPICICCWLCTSLHFVCLESSECPEKERITMWTCKKDEKTKTSLLGNVYGWNALENVLLILLYFSYIIYIFVVAVAVSRTTKIVHWQSIRLRKTAFVFFILILSLFLLSLQFL